VEYWTLASSIFLAIEKYRYKVTRSPIIMFDSELALIG